jgi:hypothetical protein
LLSKAVSKCRVIISLLGNTTIHQPKNTEYADYYRTIVGLMKEHDVRRIYAMGTIYIYQAQDHSSFIRFLGTWIVRIIAPGAYQNIIAIQKFFENEQTASDIEWTVYRVGNLPALVTPQRGLLIVSKGKRMPEPLAPQAGPVR